MSHPEISRSKEPIRLFKSDVLEFFTHIHPAVVAGLWTPVVLWFLWRAIADRAQFAWAVACIPGPGMFWSASLIWTLAEYVLHRFLFHFRPRTAWQERVSFLFHGVHHAQPRSKTRLVMPPAVSIPLAALFYGLFYLVVGVVLGQAVTGLHRFFPALSPDIWPTICFTMRCITFRCVGACGVR